MERGDYSSLHATVPVGRKPGDRTQVKMKQEKFIKEYATKKHMVSKGATALTSPIKTNMAAKAYVANNARTGSPREESGAILSKMDRILSSHANSKQAREHAVVGELCSAASPNKKTHCKENTHAHTLTNKHLDRPTTANLSANKAEYVRGTATKQTGFGRVPLHNWAAMFAKPSVWPIVL